MTAEGERWGHRISAWTTRRWRSAAGNWTGPGTTWSRPHGRFSGPPDFSRDYFGDYGVPEAAGNFFTSWLDEWRLDVQALRELAEKVRLSAENYRSADDGLVSAAAWSPG